MHLAEGVAIYDPQDQGGPAAEPSVRRKWASQPIYRLLTLSFLLIALVPVTFLGYRLYQTAWDNAWREINEKHRLLALNLAAPIHVYVQDHLQMLGLLADSVTDLNRAKAPTVASVQLDNALTHLRGFRSLALVDLNGRMYAVAQRGEARPADDHAFREERSFIKTREGAQWTLSGVKRSPLTGEPTVVISQPVRNAENRLVGVLIGELRIDLIEGLRGNIRFGEKGHSAIVDQTGKVIAHPNPEWMHEMRDISEWRIVQRMVAGETGVTEFYSPFVGQQMVAGYASVPEYGWGIMVPQPKSEVETQVNRLLYSHLRWGLLGLALAALVAVSVVRWITRPINRLASAAEYLSRSDFDGNLPDTEPYAPREVRQLGAALQKLVAGLQRSKDMIKELNQSLQTRVNQATRQLRQANLQLEALARRDHLTALANRRHFESTLADSLRGGREASEHVCIMLIDVDNFKTINDRFGHAAGDAVLMELASLLESAMRPADLVARYGGDEFVAHMRCPPQVGLQRAEEILSTVRSRTFRWQEREIPITISIGLLHAHTSALGDWEALLRRADSAMYRAKDRGRNTVVQVFDS